MKILLSLLLEEISKIEAIDENTAKELKERAEEYLVKEKENIGKKLKDLGVAENLINFKRTYTRHAMLTLGEKKIKSLTRFCRTFLSDELIGGYDEKKGVRFKIDGYLEEFALTQKMKQTNLIIKC